MMNNNDIGAEPLSIDTCFESKEEFIRKRERLSNKTVNSVTNTACTTEEDQPKEINLQTSTSKSKMRKSFILTSSHRSILLIIAAVSASKTFAFSSSRRSNVRNDATFTRGYRHIRNSKANPLSFVITPSEIQRRNSREQFLSIKSNTVLYAETTEKQAGKKGKASKDDDEWNALVGAFKMYKAAYGDLKVPSRFVVPSMPPWPGKLQMRKLSLHKTTAH